MFTSRFGVFALLLALAVPAAAGLESAPSVRVLAGQASITVEASDPEGLDTLDVVYRAGDLRYSTHLSRSAPNREFSRSFTLSEMFPSVSTWPPSVTLDVSVRNTRGQSASATVSVKSRAK